ncbi:MAG: hypothetical protein ABS894_00880 [Aerococcus urinaeequi]
MINQEILDLMMGKQPLILRPELACLIGVPEALMFQQIYYWVQKEINIRDGYSWVYNTYEEWQKQFPFWSTKTIQRTITSLEKQGLIVSSSEYNKMAIDKTKWYRLNIVSSPSGQNVLSNESNCPDTRGQNVQTNNHRLPETTTKNKKEYIYFLEHTKLTQQEYDKLLALMGKDELDDFLERFNVWITGQTAGVQKRRDAYLTINKWYKDDQKKKQNQIQKSGYQTKSQRTSSVLDEAMKELSGNGSGRRDITDEVHQYGLPEFRG